MLYIENSGDLTLKQATVTGGKAAGSGGGIANHGELTVTGSTLSGNRAAAGGGIHHEGSSCTLTNSTLSGNTVTGSGGGISNSGTLTLTHVTVSGNTAADNGGGIANTGNLTLRSSLVSGNTADSAGDEVYNTGTVTADSFNLFGDSNRTGSEAFSGFTPGGSDVTATGDGTDPTALSAILDTALANNGGPTWTHALVKGGPAMDLNTPCSTGQNKDQRGKTRPLGAGCDAGAFENYGVSLLPPAFYLLLLDE